MSDTKKTIKPANPATTPAAQTPAGERDDDQHAEDRKTNAIKFGRKSGRKANGFHGI